MVPAFVVLLQHSMAVHRRQGNRPDRDPAQAAQAGGADEPHPGTRAGGPQASRWAAPAQTLVIIGAIIAVMLWKIDG